MDKKFLYGLLYSLKGLKLYHRYSVQGLENIPAKGPCMIVCNHSLITYDILMLMSEIVENYERYPFCLVDTFLVKTKLQRRFLTKFGAIEADPENAKRVLSDGNLLVVAPGGMREFLKPSKQNEHILWDDRKGFARLAIDTQTPVVLAACPAADEILHVYDSVLTRFAYKKFKFPLFFAKGLFGTPIPKPVKLDHKISQVILPPKRPKTEKAYLRRVDDFHKEIVSSMTLLLQKDTEE